jgi:magnesium-transporting ATPase (P-type)
LTAARKGHRRKVIVIGIDPHKSSHTAAALDSHTHGLLDRVRIDATLAEYRGLRAAARALLCHDPAGPARRNGSGWIRETASSQRTQPPGGLTAQEVQARRRRSEANTAVTATSRSYAAILRTNVFSFFNVILFVIGVALLALGRYSDALISVGLGLVNALISAAQEVRAKRKLDQLQLLDRAPVLVVRDGRELAFAPEEVVRSDVLRIRAGDQVVVDGPLVAGGPVEADESLLTGESDPVVKQIGDELRSGSLCVAGAGHQLAAAVGAARSPRRSRASAVTGSP